MSGGWLANGNTSPSWRKCPHELIVEERCRACRAIRVNGYRQLVHQGHGATTGADMQPVISESRGRTAA